MIITTKGKNGLKLMIDLSLYQGQEYVKLRDIAKREEISEKYLEQIVSYLQKARKVKSARGANGGYRLVKKPEEYTVGEIIKCLEGDIVLQNVYMEMMHVKNVINVFVTRYGLSLINPWMMSWSIQPFRILSIGKKMKIR